MRLLCLFACLCLTACGGVTLSTGLTVGPDGVSASPTLSGRVGGGTLHITP